MESVTSTVEMLRAYGPIAFGLVSVVVLWYAIVRPTLKERALDNAAMKNLGESVRVAAITINAAANTVKVAAEVIDRATVRLETIENKKIKN